MQASPFVTAKLIQADRVHFVGRPSFDPVPYMDGATARAYEAPLDCPLDEPEGPVPQVSVRASREERNKLCEKRRRLDVWCLLKLLRFVLVSTVASFVCLRTLRRIGSFWMLGLPTRPSTLSSWTTTMSAATALAGLELEAGEVLLMSGRDVRDFFYQFRVTEQRSQRTVLVRPKTLSSSSSARLTLLATLA